MIITRHLSALGALVLIGSNWACDSTVEPVLPTDALELRISAVSPTELDGTPGMAAIPAPMVLVTDTLGKAMAGVVVVFEVDETSAGSGASVQPARASTDVNGYATSSWMLGSNVGSQQLRASLLRPPGMTESGRSIGTVIFQARAQALELRISAVSPNELDGVPGMSVTPPIVLVTDTDAKPVTGAAVVFEVDEWSASNGASVQPARVSTDVNGYATPGSWILGSNAGYQQLRARVLHPSGTTESGQSPDAVTFHVWVWAQVPADRPFSGQIAFIRRNDPLPGQSVISGAGSIYTVNRDGNDLVRVTTGDDARPVWSPDGSRLAFVHYERESRFTVREQLCIAYRDGSPRRCMDVGYIAGRPSWSPDGGELAFIGRIARTEPLRLYATNLSDSRVITDVPDNSGSATEYCFGSTDASWSSTGRIAFIACGTIATIDPHGSGLRILPRPLPKNIGANAVAWSPDGERLAVAFMQDDCWDTCQTVIGLLSKDGTDYTDLVSDETNVSSPAWSPDGAHVIYTDGGCNTGSCMFDVRYVSADGSRGGIIVKNGFTPSWRP